MSEQCKTCKFKDAGCPVWPGITGKCVEYKPTKGDDNVQK
jgi:hypothetical protein